MTRRSTTDSDTVLRAAEDLTYTPSVEQRKLKSSFWAVYQDHPLVEKRDIGPILVDQFTADTRIHRWWKVPGFADWFTNQDEFRQRLEYLAHVALDTAEEVLSDPEASASARVSMSKLVLEAAQKMPGKDTGKGKYLDQSIADMSAEQLRAFLEKNLPQISAASEGESDQTSSEEEDHT